MSQVVISVANQKGGVGKTMTAVNLAAGLASIIRRNKKGGNVLIVDIDHQVSATPYFIKSTSLEPMSTIYKLYQEEEVDVAPEIIHPTHFPCLSIIPSCNELSINELFMAGFRGAPHRLKNFLKTQTKNFPIVIIDCPPSFNIYVMSAFIASDYILMPLTPLPESFDGVALMFKFLQNTPEIRDHITILGYIITMLRERNTVHSSYKAAITARFGDDVLGEVHDSADLNKTAVLKNIIFEAARGSRAYKEYAAISKRVMELIGSKIGNEEHKIIDGQFKLTGKEEVAIPQTDQIEAATVLDDKLSQLGLTTETIQIVRTVGLSGTGALALLAMLTNPNGAYVRTRHLARELNMTYQGLLKQIERLTDAGYLESTAGDPALGKWIRVTPNGFR